MGMKGNKHFFNSQTGSKKKTGLKTQIGQFSILVKRKKWAEV